MKPSEPAQAPPPPPPPEEVGIRKDSWAEMCCNSLQGPADDAMDQAAFWFLVLEL